MIFGAEIRKKNSQIRNFMEIFTDFQIANSQKKKLYSSSD